NQAQAAGQGAQVQPVRARQGAAADVGQDHALAEQLPAAGAGHRQGLTPASVQLDQGRDGRGGRQGRLARGGGGRRAAGGGAGGGGVGVVTKPRMSGAAPGTRGKPGPRGSEARLPRLLPLSRAGLPSSRAWVKVGPPLFWSGPSFGSLPKMLSVFIPLML